MTPRRRCAGPRWLPCCRVTRSDEGGTGGPTHDDELNERMNPTNKRRALHLHY